MLWLWLLLAWLVILGAVLGGIHVRLHEFLAWFCFFFNIQLVIFSKNFVVLLWYYLSGPGAGSPEGCPLSICRYGALSCQTQMNSATCTCGEPAWIDGTETDPFLFTCSKRTFTNCTDNQPVIDCTQIDV